MKLTLVLLAVFGFNAVLAHNFFNLDDCYRCPFFIAGSGFLPTKYCRAYIRCEEHNDLVDFGTLMCCREGMHWDHARLTCMPGLFAVPWNGCIYGDDEPEDLCPGIPKVYNDGCELVEHMADPTKFISLKFNTVMNCAPGTVFDADECVCVFGPNPHGDCCKIIHFDFTDDYDSHTCNNFVKGMNHGDVELINDKACFGGINGYVTFNFLNNYFIDNPVAEAFSMSAWVEADPSMNIPGGIVGNGNCHEYTSFRMAMDIDDAWAGIMTESDPNLILPQTAGDFGGKWMFYVMTYDGKNVNTYIDSALVHTRPASGALHNIQTESSIGVLKGIFHFFVGCIDDVSFFKCVLDQDAIDDMFDNGASNPTWPTVD